MVHSNSLRAKQTSVQFHELALAYLTSAEYLCAGVENDDLPGEFGVGLVVLSLTHHGVELFLKGAIGRVTGDPPKGHNLDSLVDEYKRMVPDTSMHIDIPFGYMDLTQSVMWRAESRQRFNSLHERFRYPTDQDGRVWPDLHEISLKTLKQDIIGVRMQVEHAWMQLVVWP